MSYHLKMKILQARFGHSKILYEYFKKGIKKPAKSYLGFLLRQSLKYLFM